MVRYSSTGTLLWRVDLARTLPSVARLLVDSAGNAYLAFNSVGDGQDIQLHKYDPSGVLIWSQAISTGFFANDIATSLALSPDEADVALTGDIAGGASWITALYDTSTGTRRWLVNAPEGTAARDVVIDSGRVYVAGMGNVGITGFLTAIAYDRNTGTRLWRTDKEGGRFHWRRRSKDGPEPGWESGRDRPSGPRLPRLVHGGLRDHRGRSLGSRPRWWIEHGRNTQRTAGHGRWHDSGDRAWKVPTFQAGSSRESRPGTHRMALCCGRHSHCWRRSG
jgi:hypothetical protein